MPTAPTKSTPPSISMVYSFLLFVITLSAQQMYAAQLASSEWLTILGGLISSVLFLLGLTFLGNLQEYLGMRTGWGAVILALAIAVVAASFVHGVSCTTCVIFSTGILYEVNKVSGVVHQQVEAKKGPHKAA